MRSKLEAIAKVFNDWLDGKREADRKLCEEVGIKFRDPFADTRVVIEERKRRVLVTFDGAGYDYLSCEGGVENPMTGQWIYVGERNQLALDKLVKEVDPNLYLENINTWSFGVWLQG